MRKSFLVMCKTNNITGICWEKFFLTIISSVKIQLIIPMIFCLSVIFLFHSCQSNQNKNDDYTGPDLSKIVVLTFDDAVKSHRTFVAPLLKELGFNATFFITYEWMEDTVNFMSWEEVGELHNMGFEIGNHCWHHWDFSQPKTAAMLEGELGLVNWELMRVGVPKPISYAWNGNGFGPEALAVLEKEGFQFARRGKQPEVPYGELKAGPGYDPERHHPLLIPTTCDGYPELDLAHFIQIMESVGKNEMPVLQFHGVPDTAHPWVNTPEDRFIEYMNYLKEEGYQVIAMRDLEKYLPEEIPDDPMLQYRYTLKGDSTLDWPDEVIATRKDLNFWLTNMLFDHRFSKEEMMQATGYSEMELDETLSGLVRTESGSNRKDILKVRPYPGVRHPRINFKDGMLSPMRGTKASIFLPWDPDEYVVLDLPEAIFTQFGLTFLGHKHIPTIFDYRKIVIENRDWRITDEGSLHNVWDLPNNMRIGADIYPGKNELDLKLWIENNTDSVLTDLQSQVCIMLKMASKFNALNNDNKIFDSPVAAVKSSNGEHWIITAWNGGNHEWGNEDCPCLHSDPRLPDCGPGETVSVTGKIWFYDGAGIEEKIKSVKEEFVTYQYNSAEAIQKNQ